MTSGTDRNSRRSLTDFLLHIHPPTVPERTLRLSLSWGLGGLGVVLALLLFLSGVLLLFVYQPSAADAYRSILRLREAVPFGIWIRNIHHWSANLLIIVVVLHFLRVLLTGAFGFGRRLNWIVGLVLLMLILSSNFTGYLLPWDQLAYWAVTIVTGMLGYIPVVGDGLQELFRGGDGIGAATLSNFFVVHVVFLPATLLLFMIWHFWLVRRAGGLIAVEAASEDLSRRRVPSVPNLIVREAAVGLSLVAAVLVTAAFWNAPLLDPANPGMSPNPARAPWYFAGIQELLLHLHPVVVVFVLPVVVGPMIFLLPFWRNAALPPGSWFGSKAGKRLAAMSAGIGTISTVLLILMDDLLLRPAAIAGVNDALIRGLLPLTAAGTFFVSLYRLLVQKRGYRRAEVVMAGMVFSLTVLLVCTAVGLWFRGPGMHLIGPWFDAAGGPG